MKHAALPLAVKPLTGSTKVLPLLNRFGHSLSEMQVRESSASGSQHGTRSALRRLATKSKFGNIDVFCSSPFRHEKAKEKLGLPERLRCYTATR